MGSLYLHGHARKVVWEKGFILSTPTCRTLGPTASLCRRPAGSTQCTTGASTAATAWSSGSGTSCPATSPPRSAPCSSRWDPPPLLSPRVYPRGPARGAPAALRGLIRGREETENHLKHAIKHPSPVLTVFFLLCSCCVPVVFLLCRWPSVRHQLLPAPPAGLCVPQASVLHPLCGGLRRPGERPADSGPWGRPTSRLRSMGTSHQ